MTRGNPALRLGLHLQYPMMPLEQQEPSWSRAAGWWTKEKSVSQTAFNLKLTETANAGRPHPAANEHLYTEKT